MYTKGDFHIHSTFSDGGLTPKEIITLAKNHNVDILALTDHNCTLGIDEAILAGNKLNITVIPGVELSTRYKNSRVHILGYFKDDSYKNELLIEILKYVKEDKVYKIKKLLGNKINFCPRNNKLCVENGIELLKFFGATVVMAHPVLLNNNIFNKLINLDFDGIEAKYFSNSEEDTKKFISIAKERDLYYTAGSDFHNVQELYRAHGMLGDIFLTEDEISYFLKKSQLPF